MGGRAAISQLVVAPAPAAALQRSIGLSRSTLARIDKFWRGLSWHCRALESLADDEIDADFVAGNGAVATKDGPMVARARLEDMRRSWIQAEVLSPLSALEGEYDSLCLGGIWSAVAEALVLSS